MVLIPVWSAGIRDSVSSKRIILGCVIKLC